MDGVLKMQETLISPTEIAPFVADPQQIRRKLHQLSFARQEARRELDANTNELEQLAKYLQTADKIIELQWQDGKVVAVDTTSGPTQAD